MTNDLVIANRPHEDLALFGTRFSRSYRLLYFIACRVLGGAEQADRAVENCWLKASQNPPQFKYEGEFRSWVLRVVIDEALAILREKKASPQGEIGLRRGSLGERNQSHNDELCC